MLNFLLSGGGHAWQQSCPMKQPSLNPCRHCMLHICVFISVPSNPNPLSLGYHKLPPCMSPHPCHDHHLFQVFPTIPIVCICVGPTFPPACVCVCVFLPSRMFKKRGGILNIWPLHSEHVWTMAIGRATITPPPQLHCLSNINKNALFCFYFTLPKSLDLWSLISSDCKFLNVIGNL